MKIHRDETDCGFWAWSRHGQMMLMAAELKLAARDVEGRKLWTRFVEPTWNYAAQVEMPTVDVMNGFSLRPRSCLGSCLWSEVKTNNCTGA